MAETEQKRAEAARGAAPGFQNCWEFKQCGREPGGAKTCEMGVCPASTAAECDGMNGGRLGGRACWTVAGTLCGGQVRGSFAQKLLACSRCDFLRQVEGEMGPSFQLLPLGRRLVDVIRDEEDRHRTFFDGVPVGLFRCNPDGELLDVNRALVRLFGHTRGDALLGKTIDVLAVDAEAAARRADALRRDGQLHDFEQPLRRADGTVFWARESSHVVLDDTGAPIYQEGILQDVTERKLAEEGVRTRDAAMAANQALLEHFQEIAMIMDAVNAVVYVSDLDTYELLYVNQYAEDRFGKCVGKRCYKALQAGQDAPCSFCTNPRLLADGKAGPPVVWEFQNTRTHDWYMCIDKAVPWIDGRLVRMEVAVDITERKRAEEAERLLAEATRVLAGSLDYRSTLAELARLIVPRFAAGCVVELVSDDGGSRAVAAEGVASPASGDPDAVLTVPLLDQGRTLGALTLIASAARGRHDARDRAFAEELGRRTALAVANARLYESAKRATRAREEILAMVSHDLRNSLGVIMLSAEAFVEPAPGDTAERRKDKGERIQRAAKRMENLIRDLLDASAIEAGRFAVQRERLDVATLLDEAIQMMQPLALQQHQLLEARLEGELPVIDADRGRLLQVFSNLVGNAIKFTVDGGHIRIGARARGSELLFVVDDTGPGIAEDALPHVFDRYWQASRAKRAGAGLGLYIVKGIVEAHGGRVWVESRLGAGSSFGFAVPSRP